MSLAETAQRLIQSKGRTITLVKSSSTPLDAQRPWRGPAALDGTGGARLNIKAVFSEKAESPMVKALAGLTSSVVRRGRSNFMVAALDLASFPLSEGDFIEDEDTTWKIDSIMREQPGSELIIAILEVSR